VSALTLDTLRRYAVARSLFPPTTLSRAIERLAFVQADPIRAPARAQDLTLRHRVRDYKAGDLERRYTALGIEEGFFVNYGFLPRTDYLRMYPRRSRPGAGVKGRAHALLEFIRERGTAHPREVDQRFAHGSTTNYWGGSSNATTHLLGGMHYRGLLRIARRDNGIRIYAVQEPADVVRDAATRRARVDALIDIIVRAYAPLPAASLHSLVLRLRYATPQWIKELKPALQRAKERLAHAQVDGVEWYWPADERPASSRYAVSERVRLLSPFDPVVWDRRRFELFWGWAYRFEAYTPAAKRKLGYYALPLLWRDRIVGWANVSNKADTLECAFGFVDRKPRHAGFNDALEAELARLRDFLGYCFLVARS
jgi:uncharacterized protein YcaQ